jgi:hypothetical protein
LDLSPLTNCCINGAEFAAWLLKVSLGCGLYPPPPVAILTMTLDLCTQLRMYKFLNFENKNNNNDLRQFCTLQLEMCATTFIRVCSFIFTKQLEVEVTGQMSTQIKTT